MKGKLFTTDLWLFLISISSLILFLVLYPHFYPEAAIRTTVSRNDIGDLGVSFIEDLGFHASDFSCQQNFSHRKEQIRYLQQYFESKKASKIMADSIPVFYWDMDFIKKSESTTNEIDHAYLDEDSIKSRYHTIQVDFDIGGNPIYLRFLRENDKDNHLEQELLFPEHQAQSEAIKFVQEILHIREGDWISQKPIQQTTADGFIYRFIWDFTSPIAGEMVSIVVDVGKYGIIRYEKVFAIPDFGKPKGVEFDYYELISSIILYGGFVLLGLVFFIKRIHLDLLDLKGGLYTLIFIFFGWFVSTWIPMSHLNTGIKIFNIIITTPFVVGYIWMMSVLGESLTREVWPDKLRVFDLIRRKILAPDVGFSMIRGLNLAFLYLAIHVILGFFCMKMCQGYYTLGDSVLHHWNSVWSGIFTVGKGFLFGFYIIMTYCLFLLPLIRRRINQCVICILILLPVLGLVHLPIPRMLPFWLDMVKNGLLGLLLVFFFYRYNFFTVLTGVVTVPLIFYGVHYINSGGGFFVLQGIILLALVGVILVLGTILIRTEVADDVIVPYVPKYMERIYEKERIHKELEIARNVQLTFLPRKIPNIKGLQIATFCNPANEVGGDYFDFIEIGSHRLGVVVGDVSGKGIPAAFYMTLIKGMIQAQARQVFSPKEVMININSLFYENAERGIFVSMIYAILDMVQKRLTFARAGHNPMIFRQSRLANSEELCPPGIAVGLEPGPVFDQTIQEKTMPLNRGDLFLFYTDGLNEAQNRNKREFGTQNLLKTVEQNDSLSANDLIIKIKKDIQSFVSGGAQYDDMTAVLIKVT